MTLRSHLQVGLGTGGSDLELSITRRNIAPAQGIHDSTPPVLPGGDPIRTLQKERRRIISQVPDPALPVFPVPTD